MNIQERERRFCDINEFSPNVSPHPVVLCLSPSFFLTSLSFSLFFSLYPFPSLFTPLSISFCLLFSLHLSFFFSFCFFSCFLSSLRLSYRDTFSLFFFSFFFLYASDVSETGWFSTRTSVSCLIEAAGQRESRTTRGKRAFARKKIIV